MTLLAHIVIVASYVLAALAVAYGLPTAIPEIGPTISYLVGAVVFVGCALIHEVLYRRAERVDLAADVSDLRHALVETRSQVRALSGDASRVKDLLKSAEARRDEQSELVAEMRVLQTLLAQLAERGAKQWAPTTGRNRVASLLDSGLGPPPVPVSSGLGELEVREILRQALEENRVDLYLQPIVSLPQRKVRYYEVFSRIRDAAGAQIVPEQYLRVAEETGLINTIDNLLLFRCVQLIRKVRRRRLDVGFFCNVSLGTLKDASFFTQFVDFMEQNAELAESLIFEFAQADLVGQDAEVGANLAQLSEMGFRFSMDQVTSLDLDYHGLARRHFKFVKIEAERLLSDHHQATLPISIQDLKTALGRTGIDLIGEKVETEALVVDLLEFNVDYGQGYLFGEPRPARDPF